MLFRSLSLLAGVLIEHQSYIRTVPCQLPDKSHYRDRYIIFFVYIYIFSSLIEKTTGYIPSIPSTSNLLGLSVCHSTCQYASLLYAPCSLPRAYCLNGHPFARLMSLRQANHLPSPYLRSILAQGISCIYCLHPRPMSHLSPIGPIPIGASSATHRSEGVHLSVCSSLHTAVTTSDHSSRTQ